jgi:hypothetical protein
LVRLGFSLVVNLYLISCQWNITILVASLTLCKPSLRFGNTVAARSKGPKADGVACPGIAEYNDRISVKEKDASIYRGLLEQVHWRHPSTYLWSLYQNMSWLRSSPVFLFGVWRRFFRLVVENVCALLVVGSVRCF